MVRGAAKLRRENRKEERTTLSVRLMPAFYDTTLATLRRLSLGSRSWHDLDRLVTTESHIQRLAAVRILQGSRAIVPRSLRHPQPHREAGLQFVHPFANFVAVNRLPDVRRPMLVEFVRVLHKKHVVGVDLILAGLTGAE